jgi:hypothetical protein
VEAYLHAILDTRHWVELSGLLHEPTVWLCERKHQTFHSIQPGWTSVPAWKQQKRKNAAPCSKTNQPSAQSLHHLSYTGVFLYCVLCSIFIRAISELQCNTIWYQVWRLKITVFELRLFDVYAWMYSQSKLHIKCQKNSDEYEKNSALRSDTFINILWKKMNNAGLEDQNVPSNHQTV